MDFEQRFLWSSDKRVVTFQMAKQRTLHVFNDNGKSIPVLLRERDGNVAVFEAVEAIPVGVYVECLGTDGLGTDCLGTDCLGTDGLGAGDGADFGPTGTVLNCRARTPRSVEHPLLEISVEFNGRKSVA